MGKYKRCPRCELNWITEDKDLCEVCKAELEGELIIDDDEDILCPRCKQNYLEPGESICSSCITAAAEAADSEESGAVVDAESIIDGETTVSLAEMEETEWNEEEENYDDDDGFGNESDLVDGDAEIEFEEEDIVEPVVEDEDDDDFDYVDPDELDDFDDDEEDDDDDDDEDLV